MNINMNEITGYNTRPNLSMLFQSLPGNSGASNLNFLADYASIKNGSYRKLMNAYYGQGNSRVSNMVDNTSLSTSRDTSRRLQEINTSAEALKKSADALLTAGEKSLFNTSEVTSTNDKGVSTTSTVFDVDAIHKAVTSFVNDYNNLLTKAGESNASSITSKINSLTGMTSSNRNLLERVGITVASDGQLSINDDTFKEADMTSVRSLFNGTGSYGFRVSAQASWIDFAVTNEANRSNTYNARGNFTNNFNTGNIFGSYF